jgi:hypothetical protein
MRSTNHRPFIVLVGMVVLIAGCGSSGASVTSGPSTPPSLETASVAPSPAATLTPQPSASPLLTPTAGSVTVNTVAVTLVDGLRVRSKPSVSDDSIKFQRLLPLGTRLYVLDGPVSASGYSWFEVASLASRADPRGWVAGADRDGEPWLGASEIVCPPLPGDLRSLAGLPSGVGLACFPRMPITVTARLISCYCDMDGSWYTPRWFFLGSGGPMLLVEPAVTRPPDDPGEWFHLDLDPAGQYPDVVPIGTVVQVTGIFDHPAAASCTVTEMDGQPVPTQDCRLEFAVTRLVGVAP